MELKKHITDEKTGISYTLCGDYYLPDLSLPEEKFYDLGRFGKAKHRHLRKCHRARLTGLRACGTLNECLHRVTKQRMAEDMMRWAGRMNSIRSRAAEAVTRA